MENRKRKEAVSLERKIELFEQYLNTGEKLNGASVFEGYPVGVWAIGIRSEVNALQKGTRKNKISLNPTEEQLEKLKSMGILERQVGPTVAEKVEEIVKWQKRYPMLHVSTGKTQNEELRGIASSEEEYISLCEEYEKMKKYYNDVRNAMSKGKLKEDQIIKCREANIGGVFGMSKAIKWIARKCGENEKIISYIIEKYKNMNTFVDLYRKSQLSECDEILGRGLVKNVLDVDGSPKSEKYNQLYQKIFDIDDSDTKLRIYSSKKLEEAMETLPEKSKYVIFRRFGLMNEDMQTSLRAIGTELNISPEGIRVLEKSALKKIRQEAIEKEVEYDLEQMKANSLVSAEERILLEQIEQDINNSNLLLFKDIRKELLKDDCKLLGEMNYLKNLKDAIKQREIKEDNIRRKISLPIEEINLSVGCFNRLKRAGIDTLGDIQSLTEKELKQINGFGARSYEELKKVLEKYQITLPQKQQEKNPQKKQQTELETAKNRKKELLDKLEKMREKNKQAEELEKEYERLLRESKEAFYKDVVPGEIAEQSEREYDE